MNSILKKVTLAYAKLHVTPLYLSEVTEKSLARVHSFPFQYRILSHMISFIMEFFIPLLCGYISRFTTLPEKEALSIILRLQHTSHLTGRLFISLLKIPVLLSLKKEYLKQEVRHPEQSEGSPSGFFANAQNDKRLLGDDDGEDI